MDPVTSLIFVEVLTVTNSITAFLLWRARPGLRGLAQISAGCLLLAVAFALMTVRLPVVIVIANIATTAAIAAATEGMVILAGGRPMRLLLPGMTALTAVLWIAMMGLLPEETRAAGGGGLCPVRGAVYPAAVAGDGKWPAVRRGPYLHGGQPAVPSGGAGRAGRGRPAAPGPELYGLTAADVAAAAGRGGGDDPDPVRDDDDGGHAAG